MTNPEIPYGWKPDPDGTGYVRMKPEELPPPPRPGYWCMLTGLEKAPEKNGLIVELITKDDKEPETQKQGDMDVVECKLGGVGGGTLAGTRGASHLLLAEKRGSFLSCMCVCRYYVRRAG